MIKHTHDLERGRSRSVIISKIVNNQYAILIMLNHARNVMTISLQSVNNEDAKIQIESYFKKFSYYEKIVKENCFSRKPLRKKVVSNILTSHTNLFNFLIEENLNPREVAPINIDELSKMFLTAVIVWNNDLRK